MNESKTTPQPIPRIGPFLPVALMGLVMTAGTDEAAVPAADLQSLIDVERAFAETSRAEGMRTAFLSFLGEGSVVFRPGPVDAREWFDSLSEPDGALLWEPKFAEISSTGNLGYTTGPWEFRAEGGSAWGHYVTIWSREDDGDWKVLVDLGNSYPKPHDPAPELDWVAAPKRPDTSAGEGSSTLRESELAFSSRVTEAGAEAAYAEYTTRDVRFYRNGSPPSTGRKLARQALAEVPGTLAWEPEHAGTDGHLGYTWGRARLRSPEGELSAFSYLRIWRQVRGGSWNVALEVMVPRPEEPAGD